MLYRNRIGRRPCTGNRLMVLKDGNPGSGNFQGFQVTKIYHKMIISSERRKMQDEMLKTSLILEGGWEMVDAELTVVSTGIAGIPRWVKARFLSDMPCDSIEELTFFYHQGADAVVLNRDHKNANFYELLVTSYLGTTDEGREELKEKAPVDAIGTALDLLGQIIKYRKEKLKDGSTV